VRTFVAFILRKTSFNGHYLNHYFDEEPFSDPQRSTFSSGRIPLLCAVLWQKSRNASRYRPFGDQCGC
jgi:hypothetical protein